MLGNIIATTLVSGDRAFKLSIDTEISKYPIIDFFDDKKFF
ncbi:hypothetical protein [Clostridium perfringens]|uniref:Uncharacterized protein n=1 Tax=Clostridium perfringens TaxID=1502 RepID=A0A133NER3_CLOPF|nr:hypothetical protein [Clostridium perfringens]KXA14779.1 hypothetical protein HMPREF3222_00104 [Clostridium perfringens]BDA29195.1 hypothetical protein CPBEC3_23300 [Clostridium perfringens]